MTLRQLIRDISGVCLTILVALLAGLGMQAIGAPAPFLFGSLLGVWAFGAGVKPLRSNLGFPRWLYVPVTLGLGVLVGSMFNPGVLSSMATWWDTVVAMIGATILASFAGYSYLFRVRNYEKNLAVLCSLPGGQAELLAISRDVVEKDYVIALCHLVRVAMVFCLTPLLLAFIQGEQAVVSSNAMLAGFPGILELDHSVVLIFILTAAAGYFLGRLARLPMAHLLGPLLLSAALHLSGVIDIPRINEFVLIAQLVIGGGVGARLGQVRVRKLAGYLGDAVVNVVIIVSVYLLVAVLLVQVMEVGFLDILLAFIPGGFYEVTLLALLFGFDVAFVTFHHTIRVLMVFFTITVAVRDAGNRQ